jgi:hypothetical protein
MQIQPYMDPSDYGAALAYHRARVEGGGSPLHARVEARLAAIAATKTPRKATGASVDAILNGVRAGNAKARMGTGGT